MGNEEKRLLNGWSRLWIPAFAGMTDKEKMVRHDAPYKGEDERSVEGVGREF